jgi:hypothetical protein
VFLFRLGAAPDSCFRLASCKEDKNFSLCLQCVSACACVWVRGLLCQPHAATVCVCAVTAPRGQEHHAILAGVCACVWLGKGLSGHVCTQHDGCSPCRAPESTCGSKQAVGPSTALTWSLSHFHTSHASCLTLWHNTLTLFSLMVFESLESDVTDHSLTHLEAGGGLVCVRRVLTRVSFRSRLFWRKRTNLVLLLVRYRPSGGALFRPGGSSRTACFQGSNSEGP